MKTFFKSILAVAVCASLFTACSKDDTGFRPVERAQSNHDGLRIVRTRIGIRFPYNV